MKNWKSLSIITGILVAAIAFSASAQKRADKTSSAKAYYGSSNPNYKVKKHKKHKYSLKKPSKNKVRAQVVYNWYTKDLI